MSARGRKLTNLLTRTLGAALVIGACGVGALSPVSAQTPSVLRMARNAEPGIFIPWLIDDNTALFTMANVYDGLLRVTKDGASVEPPLAATSETSADGLTGPLPLPPAVMFFGWTPSTSNDVTASLAPPRAATHTV